MTLWWNTAEQAAADLRTGRKLIYRECSAGRFRHARVGGHRSPSTGVARRVSRRSAFDALWADQGRLEASRGTLPAVERRPSCAESGRGAEL